MQELFRVLGNKKCIAGFFLILLLNGWLNHNYYSQGFDTDVYKEYETLIEQYADTDYINAYEETDVLLNEMVMDVTIDENGTVIEPETSAYTEALQMVNGQLSYIIGYPAYLDYVKENAETMRKLSAFQAEDGFTRRNIEKTVSDFNKLQGIDLQLDKENAVSAFRDGGFSWLCLMLCPLPVLLVFLEERKKGLWQFVYATYGGRRRLAAKRCGILAAYTMVSVFVLELQRIFIIKKYAGGFGDVSRAVQSNIGFSECALKITVGQYIALSVAVRMFICICIVVFLWILSLVIKNSLGTFAVTVLMLFFEYHAYMDIDVGSVYQGFKYVNLFSFLDSGNLLAEYRNLNIFGKPVSVSAIMLYGVPALLLILCLVMILLGRRRPFMVSENILSKCMGRIAFIIKPYKHTVLAFHEGYKIYIKQYSLLVVLILAVVCIQISKPEIVRYDYATTIYNSYMEQIQGEYDSEKVEYLRQEEAVWERKMADSEQRIEEYQQRLQLGDGSETEIFASAKEYEREQEKVKQYQSASEVVGELITYSERLEKETEQGYFAGYINKIGYERLIGTKGEAGMEQSSLLIMATLVAALSAVMCYETSQNAGKFIRSTKRGRNPVLIGKSIHVAVITITVVVIVCIAQFYYIYGTYGLSGYEFSAQSLECVGSFPLRISVGQMLGLVVAGRVLVAFICAAVIMFISAKSRNLLTAVLMCAVVLLVPAVAVYMGMEVVSYISFLRPLGITHFWNY